MRFKKVLHSAAIATGVLSGSIYASPMKINGGTVSFIATGKPGFLKINGTGPDLQGVLDRDAKGLTGEVSVPLEKFVTGIDLRDEHMKEKYFEVKKYPAAILKITQFDLDAAGVAKEKPFKGTLKFHGVEREVSGVASASNEAGKETVEASFPLILSDYKIDIPSYAGIKVADTVEVRAQFQAEASK